MAWKYKSTEFLGDYNMMKAGGIFNELGVKEFYFRDSMLETVIKGLETVKPEKLSEHSYKLNDKILKFYPPESFGFLAYCKEQGIHVENPLAMGIGKNDEGDILIVDYIKGKTYRQIMNNSLLGFANHRKEMKALGKTFYSFSKRGIVPGDNHIMNYIYDGEKAVRIDLVPNHKSFLNLKWDELNNSIDSKELFEKNMKEYGESLISIVRDADSVGISLAMELFNKPNAVRYYIKNISAFLQGFANDALSKELAYAIAEKFGNFSRYMAQAKKEKKHFQEVFWNKELEGKKEILIDATALH
jgi:hypothetical protein